MKHEHPAPECSIGIGIKMSWDVTACMAMAVACQLPSDRKHTCDVLGSLKSALCWGDDLVVALGPILPVSSGFKAEVDKHGIDMPCHNMSRAV